MSQEIESWKATNRIMESHRLVPMYKINQVPS